jgi:hypothetical protein
VSAAHVVPNSKTRPGILRAIEVWEQAGSNHPNPRETLRLFDEHAEMLALLERVASEGVAMASHREEARALLARVKGTTP